MSDIVNIYDHQAYACGECGCVSFNLLRSELISCTRCQTKISRIHREMTEEERKLFDNKGETNEDV